jgi:hypothetical protein
VVCDPVIRTVGAHRLAVRSLVHRLLQRKVIFIVIHVPGCPPGTVLHHGNCTHTSLGKG